MRRGRVPLLTGLLAGLLLTGCGYPHNTEIPAQLGPEAHAPQVTRTQYEHEMSFPRDSAALARDEREALMRFLASLGGDRDAEIVVSASTHVPDALADARRDTVLRLLREHGFRPRAGDPIQRREPVIADVSLQAARYHVTLPECGDHTRARLVDFHNMPTSNFGCATQRNLGAMVAQPRDLLGGSAMGPADGERQAATIRDYRAGDLPGEINSGSESEVGFSGDLGLGGEESGGGSGGGFQ